MPIVQYPMLSIDFEREYLSVETLTPTQVPDEKWRHVDLQGHGHFWQGEELPTLEWVVTGTRWVGDEYDAIEIEVGEHRCRLCAEVMEPKKRAEYSPRSVAGLVTFTITINDESFRLSEDQYAAAVDQWLQFLRESAWRL